MTPTQAAVGVAVMGVVAAGVVAAGVAVRSGLMSVVSSVYVIPSV